MAKTRNSSRHNHPEKKKVRKQRFQPSRGHKSPTDELTSSNEESARLQVSRPRKRHQTLDETQLILCNPVSRVVPTHLLRTIIKAPPNSDGKPSAKRDDCVRKGMRVGGNVTQLQQQMLDGYKDTWHVRKVRNGHLFQPRVCHTHTCGVTSSAKPVFINDAQIMRAHAARAAESRRACAQGKGTAQGPLPQHQQLGGSTLPSRGTVVIKGPVYATLCSSCFEVDNAPQVIRDAVMRLSDPDLDESDCVECS